MCISSQACLALAMTAVCRAWDSSTWHGMYSKTCREPSHPSLQSCVIILGPRVARRDSNWALFHSQKSELPNKLILVYHYNQLFALFRVKVNVASVSMCSISPYLSSSEAEMSKEIPSAASQHLAKACCRFPKSDLPKRIGFTVHLPASDCFPMFPHVSPFPGVPMWHDVARAPWPDPL